MWLRVGPIGQIYIFGDASRLLSTEQVWVPLSVIITKCVIITQCGVITQFSTQQIDSVNAVAVFVWQSRAISQALAPPL